MATPPASSSSPSSETRAATEAEVIMVPHDTENVSCDGGHGSLGHPMVYYRFDGQDKVVCGYCDREFIRSAEA